MTIVAAVVAIVALAGAARLVARRRQAPALPSAALSPPPVAVLLPMRDEQENVDACLSAVLAQTTPVSVHVLDDGSEDATAEIAHRFAATDPRVRVSTVPLPAAGTSGKVNALAQGAAEAGAEWLLALDADTRPAPEALARALAGAEVGHLDAVSIAGAQRTGSIGEALVTPPVYALLDTVLGDWRRAARGDGPPIANGQFLMVRRTALEAVGGYAAIQGDPLDDVALVRRLRQAGFRTGFYRAPELLEVRMYDGLLASLRGWRRNLGLIFGRRGGVVAATATVALLPAAIALIAVELDRPVAALLAWGAGALASMALRSGTGSPPLWGLLYPLDALALTATLLAGWLDRALGRVAPWRGRRLDPPAAPPKAAPGAFD